MFYLYNNQQFFMYDNLLYYCIAHERFHVN